MVSSYPEKFVRLGAVALYSTVVPGQELWRTDGTEAGTYALAPEGRSKIVWNGKGWFVTSSGQLWTTDGTVAGTQQVVLPAATPALAPSRLMPGGTHFYFLSGTQLWRTDGTTGGTALVPTAALTLPPETFDEPLWSVVGSTLYFAADTNGSGFDELWRVDADGAANVLEFAVGNRIYAFTSASGLLFFQRTTNTSTALWRTDGTEAGTFPLMASEILQLPASSRMLTDGQSVWFVADEAGQRKLWRTDGTNAGTVAVAQTLPGASSGFDAEPLALLPDGKLLFIGAPLTSEPTRQGLWMFDGTTTVWLASLAAGERSRVASVIGNVAVFGVHNTLWRSDGSAAGTSVLATLTGNNNGRNWPMLSLGPVVVLGAMKGTGTFELYRTDGTPENTRLLKDVFWQTLDSNPRPFQAFRGGVLSVAMIDNAAALGSAYFTDGTDAGTAKLADSVPPEPRSIVCGGRVYFVDYWSMIATDGTVAGTQQVLNLPWAICFGESLYTSDNDGLWRVDPAARLRLSPAAGYELTPHDQSLYFTSPDYSGTSVHRTDGTPAGTVLLKKFEPAAGGVSLLAAGPYVYIGNTSAGLWRTDGTAAGTIQIDTAFVQLIDSFDGRLAFWKWTVEPTRALCSTDGTAAGTRCVDTFTDALPTLVSNGRLFYTKEGRLYSTDGFTVVDHALTGVASLDVAAGGKLYWRDAASKLVESDGSVGGTRPLTTEAVSRAVSGAGRVYFGAKELYAYDLEVAATSFAPTRIDAPGGQSVIISGRGFVAPVTLLLDRTPVAVGEVTPTSITFVAPQRAPGVYELSLVLGNGVRLALDEPLVYTCSAPVAAISAPASACPLVPVTLQGSGGTRCAWFPATGLDDASSCTPKATLTATTTYSLIVFNADGCPSTNHPSVTIDVPAVPALQMMPEGSLFAGNPLPLSDYAISVDDAGAGATYAWSLNGATLTSAASERRITFRTGCTNLSISVTVTLPGACPRFAARAFYLGAATVTSVTPRVASPGSLVTLTGAGITCVSALELWSTNHNKHLRLPTTISGETLQFRQPADADRVMPIYLLMPNGNTRLSQMAMLRAGARDFQADTFSDVFWRNTATGETSVWQMFADTTFSGLASTPVPVSWTPGPFGDFNGDGKGDVFWRNPSSGETSVWLMNGAVPSTAVRTLTVPVAWQPLGAADFDGDGRSDLFWRNASTGETSIWFMNGASFNGVRSLTVPTSWFPIAFADFNADTKGDVFWRNPSTGETSIWLMNGGLPATAVRSDTFTGPWSVAGTGDFDGDFRGDLFWRNTTTGETVVWSLSGAAIKLKQSSLVVPLSWAPVSFGDYNGDGRTDVFWHNPTTGETSVWRMQGATPISTYRSLTVTNTKWRPVP